MTDDRFTESFNDYAEVLREKRQSDDFDNLQHTLAGVEVGQQTKHGLRKEDIDPVTGQKKDIIADAVWRTLEEWLRNPQYRIAHERLVKAVREAVVEVDRVLDRIRAQLDQARADMDILLSKAARLKDGRAVFRFADGRVEDEAGNIIDPVLTDHIVWDTDMPSGEDYRALQGRIERLEAAEQDALGIQTELGDIDHRAHDNDNPFTPDELNRQADRVTDLRKRLVEIEQSVAATRPEHAKDQLEAPDAEFTTELPASSSRPSISVSRKP